MYGIEVYAEYKNGSKQAIDWTAIETALKAAGYSIERKADSNQVFVDGYPGEAVCIINELGYTTDEDDAEDES